MTATTPYLNMRCRSLEEVERARDRAGYYNSRSGDDVQDEIDELEFLIDKTLELRDRFLRVNHKSDAVQYTHDVLCDAIADLRGTRQNLIDEARNER